MCRPPEGYTGPGIHVYNADHRLEVGVSVEALWRGARVASRDRPRRRPAECWPWDGKSFDMDLPEDPLGDERAVLKMLKGCKVDPVVLVVRTLYSEIPSPEDWRRCN